MCSLSAIDSRAEQWDVVAWLLSCPFSPWISREAGTRELVFENRKDIPDRPVCPSRSHVCDDANAFARPLGQDADLDRAVTPLVEALPKAYSGELGVTSAVQAAVRKRSLVTRRAESHVAADILLCCWALFVAILGFSFLRVVATASFSCRKQRS